MNDRAQPQQGDASAKPVGRGGYVVRQGDCMDSIALEHGFFADTLWNLPENAELKRVRKDPFALLAGDRLHIPPPRPKSESRPTDARHTFRRKGVPGKFRLRLTDEDDEPRAGLPYTLDIDGHLIQGTTDGDGRIEHPIPPNARRAVLILDGGDPVELSLGHVDPIETLTGVQARLDNLGYECGDEGGKLGPATRRALERFQDDNDLPVTGEPDAATRGRLQEVHGC